MGEVVAEVVGRGYCVTVVDDGSSDDTAASAAAAGAAVVRHPVNLGQGAALQTGIAYALGASAEYVVTFDADGQHRAGDIVQLIEGLQAHGADFALGSRFLQPRPRLPLTRRLLLGAATRFTRMTTGLRITDTHNGLRAMTRAGASRIRLRQNRMAHASEFLHQVAQSGLPYVEVPVSIVYTPYSLAKGQKLRDAVTIILDLLARRLHR